MARALTAARPMPERSVKRPMRSGVSPSLISREIGSKRSVRRESRWGTRRIRWDGLLVLLVVVARTRGSGAGMGDGWEGVLSVGDCVGRGIELEDDWVVALILLLTLPAERLRRRMCEIEPRLEIGPDDRVAVFVVLDGIWRVTGRAKLRRRLKFGGGEGDNSRCWE